MLDAMVAADLKKGNSKFPFRFVVPIYQRVFTWGEKEVERLLRDLHTHFVTEMKKEPYFLGVITVVGSTVADEHFPSDSGVREKCSELILVDGQQRLTCIMLLGALLGWDIDGEKLKYEARRKDELAKERILRYASDKGDWKKCPDFGNSAMNEFFKCALDHKEMVDALRSDNDIPSKLKLFVSTLPAHPYKENLAEQNKYFEKMNSGGRQLEPHEILKVMICGKSTLENAFEKWNTAIDFSEAYESPNESNKDDSTEDSFENVVFGDAEIGDGLKDDDEEYLPGRSGLLEPSMFLIHVMALVEMDKNHEFVPQWREDRLLESFPKEEEINTDWADSFINKMVDYRQFLDEKIVHLSFDTVKNAYDYKFEDDDDGGVDQDKLAKEKVRQFQSMLYVSSQGRQGRQEWLLEAFKDIGTKILNYDTFLNKLKVIDRRLSATDEQLSADYVDNLKYADQSRWLFWRMDYLLWECVMDGQDTFLANDRGKGHQIWNGKLSSQEVKVIKSFRFHTGLSIEHLHPRVDDGDVFWNELISDGITPKKDMFYNLCLLTPSWNSTLGKDSVAVKFAKVKDLTASGKSGLQSIKMLFMFKECYGVDSNWTPATALIHLDRIKQVLTKSYLYHS